jgi:hypothetical protein
MKGSMVAQFRVGQVVTFALKEKPDMQGRVSKLHRSGRKGVAEIKPLDGTRKVSRRLQFVR